MQDDRTALVQQVCRLLDGRRHETPTLADLGEAVGLSPAHLGRVFKRTLGISPRDYLRARRLGELKHRLRHGPSVTAAVYEAGYGNPSRVYESAAERLGMTPGEYRDGGRHALIRYTTTSHPLGRILLAGTLRGICAVYLGDDDAALERELAREFPAASRARDDDGLAAWAQAVRDGVAATVAELPLDVRATAFQWQVWQQLRRIPAGQTRTYREVAEALGRPSAARAVARACATNPASLVIPCHRVVRGDGGLGGYRWGLARKQELLRREGGEAEG